ncbi:hypothetical protein, partial [Burkholderia contaminans]|uniref:hypothetical protein n=1 Tax=Burkholderia contaminans TaxID=488447 RepID=UPI001F457817
GVRLVGSAIGIRDECDPQGDRPRRAAPDRTADRTADRAACAGQLAAIVRFERRRTMRERYFALIQFR